MRMLNDRGLDLPRAASPFQGRIRPRGRSVAGGLPDHGVEGLELHHLYRAMAWLREELPATEQDGPCLKDVVEERRREAT
jgi:hypothetical protein